MTTEIGYPAQMPKPRGLVRNALHLGIGQVVTTALTMVLFAAIARTLGAAEFGVLYLISSFATFAYVFVDWGHGPYVTRQVALRPARSGELAGSVLFLRAVTALAMAILAMAITALLRYDARTQLLAGLLILAWVPQYLALTYSWIFRGRERMEYDALIQVVLKSATLVLALACFAIGGRLHALVGVYLLAGTLTFAVAVVLYKRLGFPPHRFDRHTARELIWDGAPMLAISLAIALQPYIDANLLYKLTPREVLGWYGAAWGIAGTLVAPAVILGSAVYPRLSRATADVAEFRRVLRDTFRALLMFAVLGGVGTYLFADFAVSVVYSERKYGPAGDILRAFAPALTLIYVDMLFGYAILATGRAGKLANVKILAVAVTTAVEIVLIPWFQSRIGNGGVGVVLAMAAGELLMVAGAVRLLWDQTDRAMLADGARGLVSGAITILIMRSLSFVTPFAQVPLAVCVFGVVCLILGLIRSADLQNVASRLRGRGGASA